MRVTISEISGAHDVLLSAGIVAWLNEAGVDVEAPGAADSLEGKQVNRAPAAAAPEPSPVPAPVTERRAEPGRKSKATAQFNPSDEAAKSEVVGRKTNGDRILDSLAGGPKTFTRICDEVGLDNSQVSNLLWNLKKAGRIEKDETVNPLVWKLAA